MGHPQNEDGMEALLSVEGLLLSGIMALSTAVVALFVDNRKMRRVLISHAKEMTEALVRNSLLTDKNTEAVERNSRVVSDEARETREVLLRLFSDPHIPPRTR